MRSVTGRAGILGVLLLSLLVFPAWVPSLRDPSTGLTVSGPQAAALATDTAPKTIGPVVDVVDDSTGLPLYARQANLHHAIGSITKLMTAYLAMHHLKLSQVLTVSQKAATVGGSSMWLHRGDRVKVLGLLYGLLLPSGNDAAETLAEGMAGNDRGFARMANREATILGLRCSHYVTPHGLDAKHQYSCASDVARMMRRILKIPLIVKIMGTSHYVVKGLGKNEIYSLWSTDDLLGSYPGIIGGKTGTTDEAGASLTAADRQHGKVLICVVLSSTYSGRFSDCASLLTFAFSDFEWPQTVDTMWSTASLRGQASVTDRPIPKWESPWTTVGQTGLVQAPADSH